MDAGDFEQLVRAELALRDQRYSARLFHPAQQAEADELFVQAVKTAAGFGDLADEGRKLRRARTARQRDEDQAFAGKAG
jgi:hypothetical protein